MHDKVETFSLCFSLCFSLYLFVSASTTRSTRMCMRLLAGKRDFWQKQSPCHCTQGTMLWRKSLHYTFLSIMYSWYFMVNRTGEVYARGLDKRFNSGFCVSNRVRCKTYEEGQRKYLSKRCDYNNDDEVNSQNILSDIY